MKSGHAVACVRCGNVGKPHQMGEVLRFDENEPVISLCGRCLHLLKYADAKTWKWFREYRDGLRQEK